jgi:hypothetical protein
MPNSVIDSIVETISIPVAYAALVFSQTCALAKLFLKNMAQL